MARDRRGHAGVVFIGREANSGRFTDVFRQVRLPNGDSARMMNRRVFLTAIEAAEKKLEEVVHQSGPEEHK